MTTPLENLVGTKMAVVIQCLSVETIRDLATLACSDVNDNLVTLQMLPVDIKRVIVDNELGIRSKNGNTVMFNPDGVTQLLVACQQVLNATNTTPDSVIYDFVHEGVIP